MTSSTGTNPAAAGLVARERLERHGVSTLSDAELLTIANALGRAHLPRTMSRTLDPDTHGNRPTTR